MGAVIVAGGAGVLGQAVAAELRARGHRVAIVDLSEPREGGDLACAGVDLTDPSAVAAAYRTIADSLGGIGAVVNVAGGFLWEKVESGEVANWDLMYRMNVRTAAVSCRAALPHLTTNGGAIVNVGAAGATQPGVGMAPYAASKAGVRALTESLAQELKGACVRVNAILPTIIDTPANRRDMPDADPVDWVRPEAIAKVVAFLISDDAEAVNGASILLS
ncbi:SDR family oxidoreductase [Sphingomonas gilva]|uniref:SDR family oxidoreductase n=1 Tax=Sphingomonas gilva TaxID=2305907 RepID=A0A396RRV5_9SPHN|nr:SDR family oxidoreductase [Sphingomonas gilva]RHW19278.1 SDR family oxidoreductase [Sphingomonas gilva]